MTERHPDQGGCRWPKRHRGTATGADEIGLIAAFGVGADESRKGFGTGAGVDNFDIPKVGCGCR